MQLDVLKAVELDILKRTVDVCEKLGISYLLDSGTLLGAVRHKGFIPWDDDIDISMPRADYERFLTEGQALLGTQYMIQSCRNDKRYKLPFAKVRNVNSTLYEKDVDLRIKSHGVYIDIFPIDSMPADARRQKKYVRKTKLLSALIYTDSLKSIGKSSSLKNKFIKLFLLPLHKILGVNRLCKKFDRHIKKYSALPDTAATYMTLTFEAQKIKWDKPFSTQMYLDKSKVEFEGGAYFAPQDTDAYLSCFYGDYMTPPPADKLKSVHAYLLFVPDRALPPEEIKKFLGGEDTDAKH